MKNLIFILTFLLPSFIAFTQAPDKMSYQAIVRDASNNLLNNSTVGMRVSILQGSTSGNAVFIETHTPSSNTNGLVTIEIGNGTNVNGSFSNIDWANGPFFIKTETDPAGGTNYSLSGISQLLSVPYALYAERTNDTTIWKRSANTIYYPGRVGIGKVNPGNVSLDVSGNYIQLAKDSSGAAGLVKNIPLNTAGYDGKLLLGFVPNYSTVELHHQFGGYGGGSNANNFFTTFNTTEGGISSGERMRIAPNGNVGIGTSSPQRTLHINSIMRLEPIATAPTNPSKGDIYFDNTLNKLRVFDGTTWQNCW